ETRPVADRGGNPVPPVLDKALAPRSCTTRGASLLPPGDSSGMLRWGASPGRLGRSLIVANRSKPRKRPRLPPSGMRCLCPLSLKEMRSPSKPLTPRLPVFSWVDPCRHVFFADFYPAADLVGASVILYTQASYYFRRPVMLIHAAQPLFARGEL